MYKNKKLIIINNESVSKRDNKFYCDNIEMKSLPEGLNENFEVSDHGRVRYILSGQPVRQRKNAAGYLFIIYDKKPAWHNMLYVHRMVLSTFRPKHAKCMNFCDHINRNTMDPRLINLRWSNTVLNMMNKNGVKGYRTYKYDKKDGPVVRYQPALTMLGKQTDFPLCDSPEVARAVYEYWQRRAYEVIDALCSQNIHWKIQRRILAFWAVFR